MITIIIIIIIIIIIMIMMIMTIYFCVWLCGPYLMAERSKAPPLSRLESLTTACIRFPPAACQKVASDLGLSGGFAGYSYYSATSNWLFTNKPQYRQLCLIRTCVILIFVQTGLIGRSQSLPIHIIPIRIIRILPNPDRNLGSTSVRIKQSCLYSIYLTRKETVYCVCVNDEKMW